MIQFMGVFLGMRKSTLCFSFVIVTRSLELYSYVSSLQFYKNLSTSLEDVVWKTEEDMQETK